MGDKHCNRLEATNGISIANSWPTGMRNDGPVEYGIYYDPTETTASTIKRRLSTITTDIDGPGHYIATSVARPDSQHRNDQHDDLNELTAQIYYHAAAHDLHDVLTSEEVTWWGMKWDADNTTSTWDDPQFLNEHPATGVLTVFFEVDDPSQYDAVLDIINDALPRNPPVTMTVVQSGSDGYQVEITQNTAPRDTGSACA